MDNTYKTITTNISKIYQKYEKIAKQKNQEAKSKSGSGPDKNQIIFFKTIDTVRQSLMTLSKSMDATKALAEKGQMKKYVKTTTQILKYLQSILKKKNNFLLKINNSMLQLVNQTQETVNKSAKQLLELQKQQNSRWACCGTFTKQDIFRDLMLRLRQFYANWKLILQIQPKASSDNYISQQYNQRDFLFIKDVLAKNWPQNTKPPEKPTQIIVQKKVEVIKQVIRQVATGKPNALATANQWIFGINRQLNPAIGLDIYHQQADKKQNSAAAAFLGMVYESGMLHTRDYTKAVYYYKKAANSRDPYGMYYYAKALEKGLFRDKFQPTRQQINLAFKYLTDASQSNCMQAAVDLGYIYQNGHFQQPNQNLFTINKDIKKAVTLYNKAKSQKSPKAFNNLGILLLKNRYIDINAPNNLIKTQQNAQKNIKLSLELLQQSANRGFVTAYYNLGTLYQRGEFVQQNLQKAKDLFYEGAGKGDAKCKIFYAFYLMDQTSIYRQSFQQAYKIAIRWLEDVIVSSYKKQQIQKAYYYLGLYYQYGFGVDPKPKKAVQYYQKSAYLQYSPAINKLGHCYYSGFGVKMDKSLAIGYYTQAAQKGNDQAMVNLGTAYLTGINHVLEKNPSSAYQKFQSAMKAGNTDAYVHLSQMYENGIYVKKDEKLAKELLAIAAAKKNQNAIYMLNERNLPVDEQVLLNIQNEMFIRPKPVTINEVIPYIKDLSKVKR